MNNIEQINTKLNISLRIRQNLNSIKKNIENPKHLEKIRLLKKFQKGFSLSGLTICSEDMSSKRLELDKWYGYTIIKTAYSSELAWIISKLSMSFNKIFYGMEGREYFYDLLLVNLKKDCEKNKPLNTIFKNLLINAEVILTYYENDKVFSNDLWKHLKDKKKLN